MMNMPITIDVLASAGRAKKVIFDVYKYFRYIDDTFSTFKENSEISKINNGILQIKNANRDVKKIFSLCEQTKSETGGYFDILHNGKYDPSGLVKGWAIYQASKIILSSGYNNFYIEAGGDIQASGNNEEGKPWRVGIRNPFRHEEIIKVLLAKNIGIATSGTYIRGEHIYNPFDVNPNGGENAMISLTVIGPNIYDADRIATAGFAMGNKGIEFILSLRGFEGYMINREGKAIYTPGFTKYTLQ